MSPQHFFAYGQLVLLLRSTLWMNLTLPVSGRKIPCQDILCYLKYIYAKMREEIPAGPESSVSMSTLKTGIWNQYTVFWISLFNLCNNFFFLKYEQEAWIYRYCRNSCHRFWCFIIEQYFLMRWQFSFQIWREVFKNPSHGNFLLRGYPPPPPITESGRPKS